MIYTIGHSTLEKEQFLEIAQPIDIIWDIRSHPGSKWPQYQLENLKEWLPKAGIGYHLELGLGGWRGAHLPLEDRFRNYSVDLAVYANRRFPKQRIAAKISEEFGDRPHWYNQGLWDFQFFMMLDEFFDAAVKLVEASYEQNIGIMCCECLWWKCHRSMVADYLAFNGIDAIHLQPKPIAHSEVLGNRLERYHPDVLKAWDEHRIWQFAGSL